MAALHYFLSSTNFLSRPPGLVPLFLTPIRPLCAFSSPTQQFLQNDLWLLSQGLPREFLSQERAAASRPLLHLRGLLKHAHSPGRRKALIRSQAWHLWRSAGAGAMLSQLHEGTMWRTAASLVFLWLHLQAAGKGKKRKKKSSRAGDGREQRVGTAALQALARMEGKRIALLACQRSQLHATHSSTCCYGADMGWGLCRRDGRLGGR